MLIKQIKGKKFNGDKLILVETKGEEPITLYRLFLLVNQFALNESKRYKQFLPSLLFQDFILDAIKHGKEGTDFLDYKNDWIVKEIFKIAYPKTYETKFNSYKQTRINDFGIKENGKS